MAKNTSTGKNKNSKTAKQIVKQTATKTVAKSVKKNAEKKKAKTVEKMPEVCVDEIFPLEEEQASKVPGGKEKCAPSEQTAEKCDTFKLYVKEASSFGRITVEDEIILAEKIHSGNTVQSEEARQKLIRANLLLVVKIAHDFKGRGLELQDLISEGNLGLMRAAEKFDPGKGAKFSSYAAWWIKQSMHRAISNQRSVIRVPVQSAAKLHLIHRCIRSCVAEHGYSPSITELAELTQLSCRTVRTLLLSDRRVISLQDEIREGEEGTMMEILEDETIPAPDRELLGKECFSQVEHLLCHLTDREREILELRFGLHGQKVLTLEEVSQKIKRTRERVRQLQNQALEKLRTFLQEDGSSYASAS